MSEKNKNVEILKKAAGALVVLAKDKVSKANESNLESTSGDGMDSALTRGDSETIGDNTYTYTTEKLTGTHTYADHLNTETGEIEKLKDYKASSSDLTDSSKYKQDHYVAKDSVEKAVGETPAFDEIVGTDANAGLVTKMRGTLEDPNVVNSVYQDRIFIDGTASEEDIRQGGIGNCYFLAALLQVIRHDPSTITNMMKVNGTTVTTSFYHKVKKQKKNWLGKTKTVDEWIKQDISVQTGILKQNNKYKTSHYRIDYNPESSVWSSSVDTSTLKITREDMYEAASWVLCMEQAYMIFAQQYGQYGEGNATGKDLVESISGGHAQNCIQLFFGDKVKSDSVELLTVDNTDPDADLIQNNQEVISLLLKYAKQQNGKGNKDVYLMAGISTTEAVSQLEIYSNATANALKPLVGDNENLKQALADIEEIHEKITHYYDVKDEPGREGESGKWQKSIRDDIDALSIKLQSNDDFKNLNLASYQTLRESIGIVVSKVTGSKENYNNIFIYSGHAYSVDSLLLVDKKGKDLTKGLHFSPETKVDADLSKVTLINPHAKTKAALNEAEDRYNDGKFEISLRSFLNNVGYVRTATVKN